MNSISLSVHMAIGLMVGASFACLFWVYAHFKKLLAELDTTIEKIIHFSNADPLTGLANRTQFFENFKNRIALARPENQKLALFFLDIDNFRGIKDSLGYDIGDGLLQAIAKRLSIGFSNKRELLARLGSDQFTIMIDQLDSQNNIDDEARRILSFLAQPFLIQGHEITITASIGISLYPDDSEDIESLLKFSGIARHQAKRIGSNTFNYYTLDMNTEIAVKQTIEMHLRNAISNKELTVCYQPKVDVKTRKIIGAEALLQWNNAELGRVSPAQFIPLAEQTGLIVSIGNWILKEACMQTKKWHDQGFNDFSIAINLSSYQFKMGDIAEQVASAIWDSKLPSNFLELELTESLVMENMEKSLLMLRVLKSMGIKISIDDFGTGYSSLSNLRKFPVDTLKIDQSFVKNIGHATKELDDSAIITTIITMAKQLKLKVVAEGVETEAQFNFLNEEGCDFIQGYLFGRPLLEDEFIALLTENWDNPL
ncbi:MAG TPA: bifunctional diguanylate cyclase/phosphodiesterase [Gammaproteobacteria bacterium]|nr:bifunctional diguanylate cyclase/phosphodiesterase [Gammaproteobacteria bacterium]